MCGFCNRKEYTGESIGDIYERTDSTITRHYIFGYEDSTRYRVESRTLFDKCGPFTIETKTSININYCPMCGRKLNNKMEDNLE